MARTDHLWNTLDATSEWIRFGDAKAAVALTADAVLVAALAQTVLSGSQQQRWPVLLFAGTSVLAAATSGILALVAVIPKFNAGPPKSVLFFNGIAEYPDADSFKAASAPCLRAKKSWSAACKASFTPCLIMLIVNIGSSDGLSRS
jgi:hypothetical protein